MTFFEQTNDDETHWSSECCTTISSPGTINLNSPLSQDDYYAIMHSHLNVDLNLSQACCSLSECSNMIGSLGSVELNLPLTRQQPSAMLDSSEFRDVFFFGINIQAITPRNQTYCTKTFTQKFNMKNTRMMNYETFISFELSDSSSENETDDCNINSRRKYSFYIKVNDAFNSFEEIGKKNLISMLWNVDLQSEKGVPIHMRNGSVWNATW
ncbi:23426_t:CDS:2 [Gigaspora margarita]|uniref:23426_t:CDS:1 n=1 Tax=Gigaspora margarita TaxID=4874 RepID=A0ABM8VVY6_GIGMA|nr:23426_t:CDS:2 [Gigaspora margarita]